MNLRSGSLWFLGLVIATFGATAAPPSIWFGAEPPVPLGSANPKGGSVDYAEFLSSDAQWRRAAGVISVVEINASWIEKVATPEQLGKAIKVLGSHQIKLALELNGLSKGPTCGGDGFASRDPLIPVRRILAAGGTVDYVVLNEPFAWASQVGDPASCHWTPQQVAGHLKPFLANLRKLVPGVRIGDAEPLWKETDAGDFAKWADIYAEETGSKLAFFQMDFDFTRSDWVRAALSVEREMRSRGIIFGIHYFGNRTDGSDHKWLATAFERSQAFARAGGRPDQVILQSWHPLPRHILPESERDTFMAFVLHFAESQGINKIP